MTNAPFGEDRWQAEMFDGFSQALVAGVLLVFAVLVLLYHRFVSPLVNMGSLFLAPLGGLMMLLIAGQQLSMPVVIGILMLFGIVAKNSILLIDFAIEEMAQGASKFEAIMEAGHKRAQPIVMTTVAMTAGMIPTAVSLGGDGAWRAPMGTVVIGGLVMSTMLTLLIVPAAFSLADGFEKRHRAQAAPLVPDLQARTWRGRDLSCRHRSGGATRRVNGMRRLPPAQPSPTAPGACGSSPPACCWSWRSPSWCCGALAGMHPAWGYALAFTEAAMVGGLADWFAVTALFRRPLGLPIPHTAIIPENKDRIAETMAAFLRDNFLTPMVIARRMRGYNIAATTGSYLAEPARGGQSRLRAGAANLLGDMLELLDPEQLGGLVKRGPAQPAGADRSCSAARPAAHRRDRRPAAPAGAGRADPPRRLTIEDNEALVRDIIHRQANTLLRWTGLDEKLANSALDGLYKLLAETLVDPQSPAARQGRRGA